MDWKRCLWRRNQDLLLFGFLILVLSASTAISTATTTISTTSSTASSVSNLQLIQVTINFTLTNLQYVADLNNENNEALNITSQVEKVLQNSSLAPVFTSCHSVSYSPGPNNSTKAVISCLFKNDLSPPPFNRYTIYQLLDSATQTTTKLGPYTLEPKSLYVNNYGGPTSKIPVVGTSTSTASSTVSTSTSTASSKISTSTSTASSTVSTSTSTASSTVSTASTTSTNLIRVTVNFTLTNLPFTSALNNKNNIVAKNVSSQVDQILKSSSLAPVFSSCHSFSYSAGPQNVTKAVISCGFKNDTSPPQFNKYNIYDLLQNKTQNGTNLGPYTMQPNSLYVNNYQKQPTVTPTVSTSTSTASSTASTTQSTVPPTVSTLSSASGNKTPILSVSTAISTATTTISTTSSTASSVSNLQLIQVTINFTLTNLQYVANLNNENNEALNITSQVEKVLQNSSLAPVFTSCHSVSYSPGPNNSTKAVISCLFKNDLSPPPFNRYTIYQLLDSATQNTTKLGPYTLEPKSLYVNNYGGPTSKIPVVGTSTSTASSTVSTSTSTASSTISTSTSTASSTVSTSTSTASSTVSTASTTSTNLTRVTVNFTLTNLPFTSALNNKNNIVAKNVSSQVDQILKSSSLAPVFSSCHSFSYSAGPQNVTKAVISCGFKNDTSPPQFNKYNIYDLLQNKTQNGTNLGPYTMQPNSLYVNNYQKQPTVIPTVSTTTSTASSTASTTQSTVPPTVSTLSSASGNTTPKPIYLTVNFTLTNLPFTSALNNKNNIIAKNITSLANQLLQNSTFAPVFSSCHSVSYSAGPQNVTKAVISCGFKNDTSPPQFNKYNIYDLLQNKTQNGTNLGPYTMQPNSLYVNNYQKQPTVIPTVSTTTSTASSTASTTQSTVPPTVSTLSSASGNTTPKPIYLTVNFTLTNLPFTSALNNKNNIIAKNITSLTNQLLQNSTFAPVFSSCHSVSYSAGPQNVTNVVISCGFKNDTSPPQFNKYNIYDLLQNKTQNGTNLGPYTMQPNSLYVNNYQKQPTVIPTVSTTTSTASSTASTTLSTVPPTVSTLSSASGNTTPKPIYLTVNFTLTNLPFTSALNNKNNIIAKNITSLANQLLQNSTLAPVFSSCHSVSYSAGPQNVTKAVISCGFKNDTSPTQFNKYNIYDLLQNKTQNGTNLGPYTMQPNSLYVNNYQKQPTIIPTVSTTTSTASSTASTTQSTVPPTVSTLSSASGNTTPKPIYLTVNFTLTNLPFTSELNNKNNIIAKNITSLANQLLQNSTLAPCFHLVILLVTVQVPKTLQKQ
ncbi:mucin-16-like [Polypterus senegalus]|uniref:mucin-16-like n=1 Tax=Polypterus senegalus TaxID=55291 RepID=UPI0019650227|nr:mucin-16-like [Polypterus senegalus]